jgi:hypothetical protein
MEAPSSLSRKYPVRFYIDREIKHGVTNLRWHAGRWTARLLDPEAVRYYDHIASHSFDIENVITVVPSHRVIYFLIPKAANTRIRATLGEVSGRRSFSLLPSRWNRVGYPRHPRTISVRAFHQLATDPRTLRFTFVRNPYDRLVSCWSNKFLGKPLVKKKMFTEGEFSIERYLKAKKEIDAPLPEGADQTLSFPDFVTYATAIARRGVDYHMQTQSDLMRIQGLPLDYIGKVENFSTDIVRVLDHINASDELRKQVTVPLNKSDRSRAAEYYTPELAERVFRAYEEDFNLLGYSRALPA